MPEKNKLEQTFPKRFSLQETTNKELHDGKRKRDTPGPFMIVDEVLSKIKQTVVFVFSQTPCAPWCLFVTRVSDFYHRWSTAPALVVVVHNPRPERSSGYLHGGGEGPSQHHGYQAPRGPSAAWSRAIAGHRQSDFLRVQRLACAWRCQCLLLQTGQEEASAGQGVSYRAPPAQRKG